MQKSIKIICLLLVAGLLFLTPASIFAQNNTNLAKKYYEGIFGNPKNFDDKKYTPGTEELLYYKATDWDNAAMQLKYDGIKPMVMETFVKNINPPPYDSANPAGWIVAVHYPMNTGNSDVDLDITQKAVAYYEIDLPPADKMALALNTNNWPAADTVNDADNDFNTNKVLFYLSYLNKRLTQIQNMEYVYPAENAGLIYTAITTYQITKPSDKYISVIFTKWFFAGGAHDAWQSNVVSYDLTTGKELDISDLLTDKDNGKLTAKFKALDEAARGKNNFVAEFNAGKYPDLDMAHMALTPEGLMLIFNPYEIGSFAEGSIIYQIDKQDLNDLGINTKFWQ